MRSVTAALLVSAASLCAADVEVRYIAHAAFQITSPGGTRLVVDPYNSHVWLGYTFPENVEAEGVLVSHPHFDHDAHYYVRGFPAVYRNPGSYAVGDFRITGVRGRHADPYGGEFGQLNTIWIVESAGLRLVHLGDNGPLDAGQLRAVGRADVLFAPVDETEHILKFRELEAMVAALRPRILVPMHYRFEPGMGPDDLGTMDAWLAKQPRVQTAGGAARWSAASLPKQTTVRRFRPSPEARPWTSQFWEAIRVVREFNRLLDRTKGNPDRQELSEIGPRLTAAVSREPGFIAGWHARATLARLEGRPEEAIRLLETGLAVTRPDDTERTTLAQALLAEWLTERGRLAEARALWTDLLRTSHRTDLREKARRSLAEGR